MLTPKKGLARADFSVILTPMLGAIAFWVSHLIRSGTKQCLWYNPLALLNARFARARSKQQSLGKTLPLLDRVFVFRNRESCTTHLCVKYLATCLRM